ncbi:hypothetical protein PtA15_17A200 [Puccinia triticina]|uniref:Uncharacterized protein n=1 Tax=Puccinia triticina TaxID=208348 RepID=A0ABY7D6N0_9BASI|nr:uncharacterized protein PtA15_17A200 [Puccinia triticina]WAQ92718.1 hypothetical protein PtA15_17A200 [Puccinia triticina]
MYPQVAPVTVAAMLLPVDTIGRNSHQSRPSPPPIIVLNAATHHHHTQTYSPNNTPSADETTIALPADHTKPFAIHHALAPHGHPNQSTPSTPISHPHFILQLFAQTARHVYNTAAQPTAFNPASNIQPPASQRAVSCPYRSSPAPAVQSSPRQITTVQRHHTHLFTSAWPSKPAQPGTTPRSVVTNLETLQQNLHQMHTVDETNPTTFSAKKPDNVTDETPPSTSQSPTPHPTVYKKATIIKNPPTTSAKGKQKLIEESDQESDKASNKDDETNEDANDKPDTLAPAKKGRPRKEILRDAAKCMKKF